MSTYFENQPTPDMIKQKIRGYSSWLEIDLDNLTHNLAEIKRHVGVQVMAVVKNNAYGHGLIEDMDHPNGLTKDDLDPSLHELYDYLSGEDDA